MASTSLRFATTLLACGLVLSVVGCGRTQPLARPALMAGKLGAVAARGVAPDHDRVIVEDLRRAAHWMPDAKLVMAIHATVLNSTKISASANVFYSQEAAVQGRTAVFTARHYGFRPLGQYVQVADYAHVARSLKPIGAYAVRSEDAWSIAKRHTPAQPSAQHDPSQPGPNPQPQPAANRFLLSTTAFLVQPEQGDPVWNFYSGKQKFTINARTKEVLTQGARSNTIDPLNAQWDAELQRAASTWLPVSPAQPVQREEPKGTN